MKGRTERSSSSSLAALQWYNWGGLGQGKVVKLVPAPSCCSAPSRKTLALLRKK